jgi:DNA-binding LytR/AlgR family response regulator
MTIVIIEDEALAAEKLQRTLLEVAPGSHVVATLASVEDAVIWFKTNAPPDLIFSDIQLLDGLSFEIFQRVSIHQPVVFTTAYDQYAIRAFEVNSIDYLLKPVQQEKLKQSLEKFRTVSKVAAKPNDFEAVLKYLKGSQDQYKSGSWSGSARRSWPSQSKRSPIFTVRISLLTLSIKKENVSRLIKHWRSCWMYSIQSCFSGSIVSISLHLIVLQRCIRTSKVVSNLYFSQKQKKMW